jgi:hypothetical protein
MQDNPSFTRKKQTGYACLLFCLIRRRPFGRIMADRRNAGVFEILFELFVQPLKALDQRLGTASRFFLTHGTILYQIGYTTAKPRKIEGVYLL